MQSKINKEDLVSDFLISVISFEQGTKLCFTSEQGKGLKPITATTTTRKGILKRQAEFFLSFQEKKNNWEIFPPGKLPFFFFQ